MAGHGGMSWIVKVEYLTPRSGPQFRITPEPHFEHFTGMDLEERARTYASQMCLDPNVRAITFSRVLT
jgi:hypothetical protein